MKRLYKMTTVLILMAVLFSGCNKKSESAVNNTSKKNASQDVKSNSKDDKGNKKLEDFQTTQEKIDFLLEYMTLEEKAGQMCQGGFGNVTANEMKKLALGSVLSGGGAYPGNNTIEDWNNYITDLQSGAMKTDLKIPMLYGLDAVHGLALVKNAVVYPQNIGLGAANDPELMYQMGAAVAEEMKLIKTLWNFSPCVAVNTDPRWGRTYECFSSDTSIVTSLAKAYIKGQTDHGIAATAKHYAGDGAATYGTGSPYFHFLIDQGDTNISEEEFRAVHLAPYKELVESGVKVVMASFSSFQGVKMHENKYLLTDVLKNEFGFQGFIVTDWAGVNYLSGSSYEENVALAINAGIDMLMEPDNYKTAKDAIINGVNKGSIPIERVNDAVSRILKVKIEMGLFEDPYMDNLSHEVNEVGDQKYRDLAKQLVEKSLVLLKNDNAVLPLKKGQKIFVTGPALNDMGLQCGGWGLTWQGIMDNGQGKVTKGTTILEGLEEYGKSNGIEIITDEKRASEADIVILAVGEVPYAEGKGDTADLSITGSLAHPDNKSAIDYVKSLGKPTVTLIIAGRNVMISEYMDDWDGIVMCYLPGTEGDGVASVLCGEAPFTGKLPMPYYKNVEQIGKENSEYLFDIGYGLSY